MAQFFSIRSMQDPSSLSKALTSKKASFTSSPTNWVTSNANDNKQKDGEEEQTIDRELMLVDIN